MPGTANSADMYPIIVLFFSPGLICTHVLFHTYAAGGEGGGAASGGAVEGRGGGGGGGNDYFRKAHSKSEAVRQPSTLKGGTLKEYQLRGLQWMVSDRNRVKSTDACSFNLAPWV